MTMKTDLEVIEDALALIELEDGWTQGTYCRDTEGNQVSPVPASPGEWVRVRTEHVGAGGYVARTEAGATPCKFCLQGALRVASGYWQHGAQADAVREQVQRLEQLLLELANSVAAQVWPSVSAYNDDARTTRTDVVLTLKRAAAHLDAQMPKQR
ncbi:hypothetical protein AU193_19600 [Mycobacterium sp. GA-1285]|nr:hypothetical protein AU193_19600 [Mycobacterium sp. GA-1285]